MLPESWLYWKKKKKKSTYHFAPTIAKLINLYTVIGFTNVPYVGLPKQMFNLATTESSYFQIKNIIQEIWFN